MNKTKTFNKKTFENLKKLLENSDVQRIGREILNGDDEELVEAYETFHSDKRKVMRK